MIFSMTKIFHNSINLDCFSWESIVGIKKSYFGRTLTIVILSNALIQNIISTKMEVDNTEQNICIFVFQFIIFFQKKKCLLVHLLTYWFRLWKQSNPNLAICWLMWCTCFDGQIRAASEDALEVEKTTRKWLSIMNKDCNRFCKILVRFYLLLWSHWLSFIYKFGLTWYFWHYYV